MRSHSLNGQGWSADEQYRWYRASQGSRLIPYSWLVALEEKGSNEPFLRTENVERFRYLKPTPDDSSQLPIGFAIDRTPDDDLGITRLRWFEGQKSKEPWVGLNCSACHTSEMTYRGQHLRIDGAPTIADFQSFEEELHEALSETSTDPAKWVRFAKAVLAGKDSETNRATLRTEFVKFAARQQDLAAMNASSSRYGYARLDAVGHILNRVAFLDGAVGQFGGPADAPVSYPFIWNTHQHDFVQWNGIAGNKGFKLPSGETFDVGAMGRNTGEVIGVFADVVVSKDPRLGGYRSSVDVRNLDAMETQLSRLKSPEWPAALFGPYDAALAAEGQVLFERNCVKCHAHLDRDDLQTPIVAHMSPIWGSPDQDPVGTDPWMACNAFTYKARSGNLEGLSKGYFPGGALIEGVDYTRDLLGTTAVGVLVGKKWQIAETAARALFGLPRKPRIAALVPAEEVARQDEKAKRLRDCELNKTDRLMAYKGRPLNGIWATAPYLHNGSVKSLYEILLPPDKRAKSFNVGSREYDPVKVGYVDAPNPNAFVFKTYDDSGKPILGNSNEGHDYGNASRTEHERDALVEYMKTL
jgi:hypothetical protein